MALGHCIGRRVGRIPASGDLSTSQTLLSRDDSKLTGIVPIFTGDDPPSGIFAVLLGSPWAQLLSSALSAAGSTSGSLAAGLVLAGIGIAVNTTIAYLVSRGLVRRSTPR